jgi:hypothetical protein
VLRALAARSLFRSSLQSSYWSLCCLETTNVPDLNSEPPKYWVQHIAGM